MKRLTFNFDLKVEKVINTAAIGIALAVMVSGLKNEKHNNVKG
jgi:hypothetical protein